MLTYVELFAGAGGLSRALDLAGWRCLAHAEIERHARAVLRYHWPDVRLDGDVATVRGADYKGATLVSGGSPCQDLSRAGKRRGLDGERSGLFYEQIRVWKESESPYLLWENVAGALSTNSGADFAAVLSAIVGDAVAIPSGGWASGGVAAGRYAVAAWRLLDLQYFGPPQARVRLVVVAARAGGADPAEVLSLSESNCGHSTPREQQRFRRLAEASLVFGDTASGVSSVDVVLPSLAMGAHTAGPGSNGQDALRYAAAMHSVGVPRPRRLTPRECERLMSWPDDWTRYGINEKGKQYELADTPRYRLCGNGVGTVCFQWVAQRLADAILSPTSLDYVA